MPSRHGLPAADSPRFVAQEIDPHVGNVCYAVTVADVNGDGKLDVVAVTEDAVVWYENPSWTKHDIIRGATEQDNVCIQPHDIDGDGRIDFALGAGWRPPDTPEASTLQWLGRDAAGQWQVHPIRFEEPTLHRLRWGDVQGHRQEAARRRPAQGRGTKGPNWGEGQGVRVLVYDVPADPTDESWPVEVADESLHTIHNLQLVDLDGDRRDEIVLACLGRRVRAGPRRGRRAGRETQLGTGNQESTPFKGSSEVKVGRLRHGRPLHRHDRALARHSRSSSTRRRRASAPRTALGPPGHRRAARSGATPSGAPTSTATATTS